MVEQRPEQAAQVVERHLERAAEAVEPRLPAAGRSGTKAEHAWVIPNERQATPNGAVWGLTRRT